MAAPEIISFVPIFSFTMMLLGEDLEGNFAETVSGQDGGAERQVVAEIAVGERLAGL
jgi:hypothetical protein